ncbi:hypothetical protein LguiB_023670 [Lonicera macranthoides]
MEKKTDSNESYELGYQPSVDQTNESNKERNECSTLSGDSLERLRTNSEISEFSELTDDSICSSKAPSPLKINYTTNSSAKLKHAFENELKEREPADLELEMMKERFAKLLLGEDMSGSGKGVSTATTLSNAITNLYACVYGQHLRLEPLHPEKMTMWKREMNCLLAVCDYIVEFIPASQNLQGGSAFEVMRSRPRSDIYMNLPALRKLDAMLLEILESFQDREYWYVEEGNLSDNSRRIGSFRWIIAQPLPRKEEKWWLPVPRVPYGGLSEKLRKHLKHKRDCAFQIHKASMAINSSILAEMEVPETYLASLPKSGKASVGDSIYHHMWTAQEFSPDNLLDCLNVSTEHEALELADQVEASIYIWRQKACERHSKSSWTMVKDLVSDTDRTDKYTILAQRAESLLFCLKQRYPELSQTTLDTSKIQYNRVRCWASNTRELFKSVGGFSIQHCCLD